jgi:transcription antitermination factor NusG
MSLGNRDAHTTKDAKSNDFAAEGGLVSSPHWYAIHTRAKHEKRVAAELQERSIETFVPISREVHRWSDRRRVVEAPLFPCYAFVRTVMNPQAQAAVLQHSSVLRWIGFSGTPTPIPEEEICAIQAVLRSGVPVGQHTFVKFGERVRICGGSLDGVEGVLVEHNNDRKLVVSVEAVGRSIAIALHSYQVVPAAQVSTLPGASFGTGGALYFSER